MDFDKSNDVCAFGAGRQFDKDGNMMQWWNNATIKAFRERAQCIIDQYSRYKIDEVGLYVNGRMTQGENIADNGGLKQSFRVNYLLPYCLFYNPTVVSWVLYGKSVMLFNILITGEHSAQIDFNSIELTRESSYIIY